MVIRYDIVPELDDNEVLKIRHPHLTIHFHRFSGLWASPSVDYPPDEIPCMPKSGERPVTYSTPLKCTNSNWGFPYNCSLGFYPLQPQWSGPMWHPFAFDDAEAVIEAQKISNSWKSLYRLKANYQAKWTQQEDFLKKVYNAFLDPLILLVHPNQLIEPAMPWPKDYGYTNIYSDLSEAIFAVTRARTAFQGVVSHISFLVALWTSKQLDQALPPPLKPGALQTPALSTMWTSWLIREHGLDVQTVKDFAQSFAFDFSRGTRPGVFFSATHTPCAVVFEAYFIAGVPLWMFWKRVLPKTVYNYEAIRPYRPTQAEYTALALFESGTDPAHGSLNLSVAIPNEGWRASTIPPPFLDHSGSAKDASPRSADKDLFQASQETAQGIAVGHISPPTDPPPPQHFGPLGQNLPPPSPYKDQSVHQYSKEPCIIDLTNDPEPCIIDLTDADSCSASTEIGQPLPPLVQLQLSSLPVIPSPSAELSYITDVPERSYAPVTLMLEDLLKRRYFFNGSIPYTFHPGMLDQDYHEACAQHLARGEGGDKKGREGEHRAPQQTKEQNKLAKKQKRRRAYQQKKHRVDKLQRRRRAKARAHAAGAMDVVFEMSLEELEGPVEPPPAPPAPADRVVDSRSLGHHYVWNFDIAKETFGWPKADDDLAPLLHNLYNFFVGCNEFNPELPFDISPSSYQALLKSQFVYEKNIQDFYIIGDRSRPLHQQSLLMGVKSATTALQVLREDGPLSLTPCMLGIRFHLFQTSPFQPSTTHREVSSTLKVELLPTPFNAQQQYLDYVRKRETLLSNPSVCRAAICSGGILWRLSAHNLGSKLIQDGPSPDAIQYGFCGGTVRGGTFLIDDNMSEEEESVIIGTYVNGDTLDKQVLTWWPSTHTWERSRFNLGYWTPDAEDWFCDRLRAITKGDAKPMSGKAWKDSLGRGSRARPHFVAAFVESVEEVCTKYLDEGINGLWSNGDACMEVDD